MSQALSGMTGFARESGSQDGVNWSWEARCVNGKSLDVRLRLPSDLSALDSPIKKHCAQMFSRGNMQISLTLQRADGGKSYRINEALLEQLKAAGGSDISALLSVFGVVEEMPKAVSEEAQKNLEAALLESFKALAAKLKASRLEEGAALAPILTQNVKDIAAHVKTASALGSVQPEAIKAKLDKKFTELLGEKLSEERLSQEAAVLAMKPDVREELDRLRAHCEQAEKLLAQGSPIGRKLDFLAQEFNRETNTLCSKSADIDLTQTGLALKSVIEQFREQAANVE